MFDDEAQSIGRLADDCEIEPPFAENRLGFRLFFGPEHHKHALLAFREHHLISGHAGFAARHFVEIQLNAQIALGAHFNG